MHALLFKFDIIVPDADVVGLEVDLLVGVADAIDLVADELAQLRYIVGVGYECSSYLCSRLQLSCHPLLPHNASSG